MQARALIDNASYGPETLKVLCEAFDGAWAEISSQYSYDDVTREVARLRLAQVVLSFAVEDSRDAEPIKRAALNTMAVMSQSAIGTLSKGQPSIAGPSGDQGMR
jgi:hypothetical protein